MNLTIRWLIYFIPALAIELFCYLTAPIVALFIHSEPRFDRVKRMGNKSLTLQRDYLIAIFYWWQTHDNAVDEWWYGAFNTDSHFKWLREATQEDYDNSWFMRYVCRVHWLWRNCAYGFHYNLFSTPSEPVKIWYTKGNENKGLWYSLHVYEHSFQLEAHLPIGKKYFSVNMGWKSHKGIARKMYANRIPPFGIREFKGI